MRVIVSGPGGVGSAALAEVITHPDLELVGVFSYSRPGIDAGDIVGLPPTGGRTTDDPDSILSTQADVVLSLPARPTA